MTVFFEFMMRHAAPVLFWISVLLFFVGTMTHLLLIGGGDPYGGGPVISPSSILTAVYQGLGASVWPFTGAGLIWTLQRKRVEDRT